LSGIDGAPCISLGRTRSTCCCSCMAIFLSCRANAGREGREQVTRAVLRPTRSLASNGSFDVRGSESGVRARAWTIRLQISCTRCISRSSRPLQHPGDGDKQNPVGRVQQQPFCFQKTHHASLMLSKGVLLSSLPRSVSMG
jgi:hypothetical protein